MSEQNIVASFRFEGKAKDRFDPPPQTFFHIGPAPLLSGAINYATPTTHLLP
jgi:hypothetical protein